MPWRKTTATQRRRSKESIPHTFQHLAQLPHVNGATPVLVERKECVFAPVDLFLCQRLSQGGQYKARQLVSTPHRTTRVSVDGAALARLCSPKRLPLFIISRRTPTTNYLFRNAENGEPRERHPRAAHHPRNNGLGGLSSYHFVFTQQALSVMAVRSSARVSRLLGPLRCMLL